MKDIFTAYLLILEKYKNAHLCAHLATEYHSSKKNTFGEFSKIMFTLLLKFKELSPLNFNSKAL